MRTIILGGAINNIICAIVMAQLWRQNRKRYAGLSFWLLDYVLQVIGMGLLVLRGQIPDFLSYVVGNVCIVGGMIALYTGLSQFLGKKSYPAFNLAILTLFTGVQYYFSFVTPNLVVRSLNLSAVLLIIFIQCLWLLLRRTDPEMRRMTSGVAAVFGAYAVVTIFRLYLFIFGNTVSEFLQSRPVDVILVFIYQMLLILLTYYFFLLVNSRLLGELRAQGEASETANKAKSRFLATMSHEFRTPMSAIIGFSNLLLDSAPAPAQRPHLETIKRSSESLLVLLNDVLDMAKVEAGKLTISQKPFSLKSVVEAAADLLSPAAAEKGLVLECDTAGVPSGVLMGDPERITQVLINLASNAIKFTETGAVQIRAERASEATTGRELVRFLVVDTGHGISPDKIGDIFAPFSAYGPGAGAGLGLTISRELVSLMGGELKVESREGEGASFLFELPLPAAPEGLPVRAEFKPGPAAKKLRVLLIEDTETNRRVATQLLERRGHAVTCAVDGRTGLELLRRGGYDIALLDLKLPDMDGIEVMAALRGTALPPVVAFTAHAMPEERARCLAAGMRGYLTKPFTVAQLYAAVESAAGVLCLGEDERVIKARAELLGRYDGDSALAEDTLNVFREEAAGLAGRVRAAAAATDMKALALQAHACKSAAATAGFVSIQAAAGRLEAAALRGDSPAALKLADELEGEMKFA